MQCDGRVLPVDSFAVADEQVLGLVRLELPGRSELEEGVHAGGVVPDREERVGAERLGDDEHPWLRPPERDLLPALRALDLDDLERRSGQALRNVEMRHPEPLRESCRIAIVTVE